MIWAAVIPAASNGCTSFDLTGYGPAAGAAPARRPDDVAAVPPANAFPAAADDAAGEPSRTAATPCTACVLSDSAAS